MKRRDFVNTGMLAAASILSSKSILADSETKSLDGKPFRKIKIAQIGVKHEHAEGKMVTLRMLPELFDIVGIAPELPEYQEQYKKKHSYRDLKWYTQEELLKIPGLEAVAVETEMTKALPTALECIKRKLHIHLDKPLGQKLEDCKFMLDACRENNVIMQPGYMFRTNQGIRLAIQAVHQGWLGDILDVTANMDRNDTDPSFRKWLATYRGGGMYDFGSHLIDFVVEMLGAPKEIHVFEKPNPKDGLNDNTLAVFLYDRTIVQLRVNLLNHQPKWKKRFLTIAGTKGHFQLFPLEDFSIDPKTHKTVPLNVTLILKEPHGEYKAGTNHIKLESFRDRYMGQLTDFAHFIRGIKKNPYTLDHELLVQKAILAASGYIPWSQK